MSVAAAEAAAATGGSRPSSRSGKKSKSTKSRSASAAAATAPQMLTPSLYVVDLGDTGGASYSPEPLPLAASEQVPQPYRSTSPLRYQDPSGSGGSSGGGGDHPTGTRSSRRSSSKKERSGRSRSAGPGAGAGPVSLSLLREAVDAARTSLLRIDSAHSAAKCLAASFAADQLAAEQHQQQQYSSHTSVGGRGGRRSSGDSDSEGHAEGKDATAEKDNDGLSAQFVNRFV